MKVLFTGMEWFPSCQVGGLDRYFYEQLEALSETGKVSGTAVVTSCAPQDNGPVKLRAMAQQGASILQRWQGARAEARRAFSEGAELVNAHFALYAFAYVSELSPSVPLVINFQGPWAEEMRVQAKTLRRRMVARLCKLIELRVYRKATRVITLSNAFRDLIHRDYGVPLKWVSVIPGALDLSRYLGSPERKDARQRLGWPPDRFILLAVRRLAKRMGLDLLIDAIACVREEFPHVLLFIGGKGPERLALERQIAERNLDGHVRLLGFVPEDDLPVAYAAADVSVVPTVALEGFGLITAESLASGTPVLGTEVGATPEILRPLDAGLLFSAPTTEAMAQRIREILRGERSLPGREVCRAYVERYGWPSVVPKILEVYKEAIEERKAHFLTQTT